MSTAKKYRANIEKWSSFWLSAMWLAVVVMFLFSAFWFADNGPTPQEAISKDDSMGFTLAIVHRIIACISAVLAGLCIGAYCIFRFKLGLVGAVLDIDERLDKIEIELEKKNEPNQ